MYDWFQVSGTRVRIYSTCIWYVQYQGVVVSSTVLVLGGVYVVLVSGTTGSSVPVLVPALVFRSTVL